MPQLLTVPLESLDSNPFRDLATYPFLEHKVASLQRSIKTVGLWEGVIARQVGGRYQTAFGHHRIEAAKRVGLTEATIILRELDDKAMLQFMGRENMSDYNSDFLTMLETWDAAVSFVPSLDGTSYQPIDIANLLGWTQNRTGTEGRNLKASSQMDRTAEACNATHKLLKDGHLKREDLAGNTVSQVREICVRASANVDRIISTAKKTKRPAAEVAAAKKQIAKAVAKTAKEASRGEVRQTDLRSKVDINTYRFAKEVKKQSPLFAQFGKQLSNTLGHMIHDDATATKLHEVKAALGSVTMDDDKAIVRSIQFALTELSSRATTWSAEMVIPTATPKEISDE